MTTPAARAAIEAVCRPVVAAAGWELEEVRVQQAGRRSVVRVVVDTDEGLDLDGVAEVSRAVSEALDASDAVPGAYTLEVTSPGVDRPLTSERHWRRNIGRLVATTHADRGLTARVLAVDEGAVTFEGEPQPLAISELGPGRVQVEFNRPDQPTDTEHVADEDDPTTGEPTDEQEGEPA